MGHECCAKKPFYLNKTVIVSGVLAVLVGLSYLVPLLASFRDTLFLYLRRLWWAVALGLVLGGVIDRFVPREYVSHILAAKKKRHQEKKDRCRIQAKNRNGFTAPFSIVIPVWCHSILKRLNGVR